MHFKEKLCDSWNSPIGAKSNFFFIKRALIKAGGAAAAAEKVTAAIEVSNEGNKSNNSVLF